ncbi:hypothetical protein [Longimicrobium sp.]|uniref:hypothetical protein n=1 Tax=Longimicrobium sp. TaxID=2029185 RepID=UPI002E34DBE8|nr:hypothetical protein [Longimicrobium sp.]HEX6041237.1 hypothetical protein [Longimicrobium sp.]
MMDDKLRAELTFLLTASLREQCVHRHAAIAERRAVFAPRPEGGRDARDTEIRMGPIRRDAGRAGV